MANDSYYFNVTRLCGIHNWTIWNDDTNDFGQCFFSLAVLCPAHALLALVSAYFIGLQSRPYYLRTQRQKWILYLRGLATLGLAVTPVINVILNAIITTFDVFLNYDGWCKIIEPGVQVSHQIHSFVEKHEELTVI